MELGQIIILIVGILLLIGIGFAYFYKKDYLKYSKLITPIFNALHQVLTAVGNIFPTNTTIKKAVTIISAGIEAAGYAEKLWLQGEIDKLARPTYAQEYLTVILERAGIAITENINVILSGIIALTCYLMPHYSDKNEQA